jgi:hypothetical protein
VEHESAEFIYPIYLCNGCLVDLRDTCPPPTDTTIITNICGRPQDAPVTCCPVDNGEVHCYATSTQ